MKTFKQYVKEGFFDFLKTDPFKEIRQKLLLQFNGNVSHVEGKIREVLADVKGDVTKALDILSKETKDPDWDKDTQYRGRLR